MLKSAQTGQISHHFQPPALQFSMNILLVEDEASIREVEKAYLQRAGYTVHEAVDGKQALEMFRSESPDLVVLDINLPELDGIEVCKQIRKSSMVPVIMVTARTEEIDELLGLELGADDYVKKPFSPNVLIARVNGLLRRTHQGVVKVNGLVIDPERVVVTKHDRKISLTSTQFNILYALAKQPGIVFTRDMILDRAYDSTLPPDILDRTVDAHIKSIRKQIEDDHSNPKYILTVIGKGYKFNDELHKAI